MKIGDIIALAKAGYKKKDIEDLLAVDTEEKKEEPDSKEEPEPEKKKEEQEPKEDPNPEEKKEDPDPEEKKEDPEPDYKKLFEESQAKIKKLQEKNRKDPSKATTPKTADEIALEHVNQLFRGV